jgi:O-antigen ligase
MLAASRSWRLNVAWSSPLAAVGTAMLLGLAVGAGAVLGSPPLALAALLGGAGCLALLRDPAFGLHGLAALAFLLPFAVIPVRVGGTLTALEAVLGLTIGATLLRALARRERLGLDGIGWLLAGLLSLATVSFILSLPYAGDLADVTRKFAKLTLATLVFLLTLRLVRDRTRIDHLLVTLMVCGGLEALVGVALYWAPRDVAVGLLSSLRPIGYPAGPEVVRFLAGENDTYTDIVRATGTSIDPNVLGGELMLVAALLVAQLCSARPRLPRWLLLPLAGVAVVGMLATHSRSSWVGLAVAIVAMATLRYRRLWLIVVPAAIGLAFLPAGRALYARVVSGFLGQDKAAGMRIDEYRNALEIIQQHPLLGIGFGAPPSIDLAPGASNIYLTVAETMGLPALALYLALLGGLLFRSVRALLGPLEPELQSNLASLLAAFIAALASGLFDHYFASTAFPHMVALFWLCGGLLWRTTRLAEVRDTTQSVPVRAPGVSMLK